ncbi:MAG: hypothetical protein CMP50_03595 [Flavobacteriales bacterium]|jgi:hypothetical protein|nr:hypothetical protein [Flavobacteriales bacterium]|tara:strand:- start:169 stop:486 length:318 start_codon:yes stop_codon:yes gene_type:complete
MSNKKENHSSKLNIEIKEEVASGVYSNLGIINHSPTEFVFDFATMMPGFSKAKVLSRIVLSPQHAKKFMNALSQNIQNFEKKNGKIKSIDIQKIPLDFGGPKAQA